VPLIFNDNKASTARFWNTADGRFRIVQPWDREKKSYCYWEIRPTRIMDIHSEAESLRYQKESAFLASLGLDARFPTRKAALEMLGLALAGEKK
jgi:hypothetical protein